MYVFVRVTFSSAYDTDEMSQSHALLLVLPKKFRTASAYFHLLGSLAVVFDLLKLELIQALAIFSEISVVSLTGNASELVLSR